MSWGLRKVWKRRESHGVTIICRFASTFEPAKLRDAATVVVTATLGILAPLQFERVDTWKSCPPAQPTFAEAIAIITSVPDRTRYGRQHDNRRLAEKKGLSGLGFDVWDG